MCRFRGDTMSEAAIHGRAGRRTGCALLLDVNNLYVNALNACRAGSQAQPVAACIDWMQRLPRGCVAEIHVAGHCVLDDIVIDDHGSRVSQAVWELHAHALERFGPVPTLVEWDTDVPPLAVLLDEAARARRVAVGGAAELDLELA
jgi:uncharacterized protein (UPF0276 family)